MLPAAYLPTYLAALALHVPCVACRRTQSVLELISVPHSQLPQYVPRPFFLVVCLPASVYLSVAQLCLSGSADAPAARRGRLWVESADASANLESSRSAAVITVAAGA